MNAKIKTQSQNNQVQPENQVDETVKKVEELHQQLLAAQEREKRSLADYQNLQRRTQAERVHLIRFASKELVQALLPVLENLENASMQIKDQGLDMVLSQLQQVLQQAGLEKIEVMGKEFDLNTMEAVDTNGKGEQVLSVIKNGYRFKGEVIQHAQVILGTKQKLN